MQQYSQRSREELEALLGELQEDYRRAWARNLKLDMSRGKPAPDQLDLSMDLFRMEGSPLAEDGTDCRNYGALDGIPEAKRLFAAIMDVEPGDLFIGGNSSLNMMHDCLSFAYCFGLPESEAPWCKLDTIKFLCPAPGYDRHFGVSGHFGCELVPVDMTPEGPDMDQVGTLIRDPAVKGMWNIPKYQNPTGITYSDETVRRLAAIKPAAKDFRIFWDNAYAVHHLDVERPDRLLSLMAELRKLGKQDMALQFSSTSKITFPGAGVAAVASGERTLGWIKKHMFLQTISADKTNQLRHARMFPNEAALKVHMAKQAEFLRPKFALVLEKLDSLRGLGIAEWHAPGGGYFISLDVADGCAKRVVSLCADAGVILTPAGATFPDGVDPRDRNIRIAPTFPCLEELEQAADLLCLCTRLASVEKLLAQ